MNCIGSFLLLLLLGQGAFGAYSSSFSRAGIITQKLNRNGIKAASWYQPALTAEDLSSSFDGESDRKSTILTATFNLAKSVIGAGVLSLPSGVAFLSDDKNALLPSTVILAFFGVLSAYSFSSIGKVCSQTDSTTFQEAWGKSVNPKSAWVISASITALCFLASLCYSIIIGDSFSALFKTFNFPDIVNNRQNTILLLSTLVLFPLCSLKSLGALAPFSLMGLAGTLYATAFMAIRLLDGSYREGGRFYNDIAVKPSFNKRGSYVIMSKFVFVLLSMLSSSFVAHYNAPIFYRELKNTNMARFNTVVVGAFTTAIALFSLVMSVGFLTFGGSSSGFIINNYASNDPLATIARLSIGLALLTGYPFTFTAMREGILDLANMSGDAREQMKKVVTYAGLGLVTVLALLLTDVGFVVSISGALFGSALMYIVPAIMTISNIRQQAKSLGKPVSKSNQLEIVGNYAMMATGLVMGGVGVAVTVLREMGQM